MLSFAACLWVSNAIFTRIFALQHSSMIYFLTSEKKMDWLWVGRSLVKSFNFSNEKIFKQLCAGKGFEVQKRLSGFAFCYSCPVLSITAFKWLNLFNSSFEMSVQLLSLSILCSPYFPPLPIPSLSVWWHCRNNSHERMQCVIMTEQNIVTGYSFRRINWHFIGKLCAWNDKNLCPISLLFRFILRIISSREASNACWWLRFSKLGWWHVFDSRMTLASLYQIVT